VGVAAAVAAAAVWAVSAVLLASQRQTVDFVSVSALRLVAASAFFLVVVWPLGASADLARMSLDDIWQLIGTAMLNLAVGDTFYIGAVMLLGVNFAYPAGLGLFALFSFLLSVIFLGETVTLDTALGSALVLAGVYVVLLYGRQPESAPAPPSGPRRAADRAPGRPRGPTSALRARMPGRVALGLVLLLVTATSWAAGTVWLRDVSQGFDAAAVGLVRIPSAMITIGAIAFLTPGSSLRRRAVSRRSHGVLAVDGLLGAGIGSLLLIVAVQDIGAGETAVLVSLSPLFALPLAAVFLGERVTPWLVVGIVLAVAGIILLSA
jgi:drug/metabolite transporter (DMT)-like permease